MLSPQAASLSASEDLVRVFLALDVTSFVSIKKTKAATYICLTRRNRGGPFVFIHGPFGTGCIMDAALGHANLLLTLPGLAHVVRNPEDMRSTFGVTQLMLLKG